ncbi:MAG: hypothetical protein U1F63_01765 [Chitinivorax sp.]
MFLVHPQQVLLFGNGSDYLLGTSLRIRVYPIPIHHIRIPESGSALWPASLVFWFFGVMSVLDIRKRVEYIENTFEGALLTLIIISGLQY